MTIIRVSHNKENPFIVVSKKVLELSTLSWEAKGLWTYLMGRPDNWNLHVDHLTKHFPCGRDKTLRMLKELIDHELCFWYQERLDSGVLKEGIYIVFESQRSKEFIKMQKEHVKSKKDKKFTKNLISKGFQPCPEKPYTVKPTKDFQPCPEKPYTAEPTTALYINKHSSKEELNEENNTPLPPKRGTRLLLYEKRRKWAYANQNIAPCGYSQAFEDKYVIVSGNIQEVYFYKKKHSFWKKLNL